MKRKFLVPLTLFYLFAGYLIAKDIFEETVFVVPFICFCLFSIMTYFSGIKNTITNRDAVIKIGSQAPYVIPFLSYSFITSFFVTGFMFWDIMFALDILTLYLVSLIVYFLAIYFLIRHLKLIFRLKIEEKKDTLKMSSVSKKRLLLINPVNPHRVGLSFSRKSAFPPLGLGIIAALTPDDIHVELIDENIKPFQYKEADLVGLTAFTSNATRAYEIAALYRDKNVPVVMGGIHASMVPDEALRYVDSIVLGEAESVWRDVMYDFQKGSLKKRYSGKYLDLTNSVIPKRDFFSENYLFATIQTSRGCPMNCNFCSVTAFNGKKFRQRPYEDVLSELESIPHKNIFFIDDNILGYGKKAEQRAINLFQSMIDKKLNKSWFCQTSLNFADNEEVIKLAALSGCKMVFIGLESPEKEQLQEMDKKLNLTMDYETAFKKINRHGIAVLGAFIYGTDTETEQSMLKKTNYIINNRIDVMDITHLTPLPGTRLFDELKKDNRLNYNNFPDDWDRYDMTEPVIKIKNMNEEEYIKTKGLCSKRLYSKKTIYKKFVQTLFHTRSIETALMAYNSNMVFRNVSQRHLG